MRKIPDVQRCGYCFSDGVGRISYELCEEDRAVSAAALSACPEPRPFRTAPCLCMHDKQVGRLPTPQATQSVHAAL